MPVGGEDAADPASVRVSTATALAAFGSCNPLLCSPVIWAMVLCGLGGRTAMPQVPATGHLQ